MKAPVVWEPHFRLNTCVECGHYLHDGPCQACKVRGKSCEDGVGRFSANECKICFLPVPPGKQTCSRECQSKLQAKILSSKHGGR